MKLLIDMNLSPRWVEALERAGLEARHWSTVGDGAASDREVFQWARRHACASSARGRESTSWTTWSPTAMETPRWETDKTVTPSPHHPQGAKGVGESATVGVPPAIANAVVDALAHLGVRHIDIPITPEKVWRILKDKGAGL